MQVDETCCRWCVKLLWQRMAGEWSVQLSTMRPLVHRIRLEHPARNRTKDTHPSVATSFDTTLWGYHWYDRRRSALVREGCRNPLPRARTTKRWNLLPFCLGDQWLWCICKSKCNGTIHRIYQSLLERCCLLSNEAGKDEQNNCPENVQCPPHEINWLPRNRLVVHQSLLFHHDLWPHLITTRTHFWTQTMHILLKSAYFTAKKSKTSFALDGVRTHACEHSGS